MYLDIIAKTEYIAGLFIVNMIYMKQWGYLGIEILCLSMFKFHHIFLSIVLLNKCQWHLILYIILLVLDSYNIMNHYFLTCSNGFQISLWAQVKGFVPNYIIKSLYSCNSLKVHILLWHSFKCGRTCVPH